MKRVLIGIALAGWFAGNCYLPAADIEVPRSLDIDSCIELALRHNRDLQRQEISLRTTALEKNNLWSLFLPSMNMEAGIDRTDTFFTESTIPDDQVSYSGAFSLNLQLNHGVVFSIDSARQAYSQAELGYEEILDRIKSLVTEEFYNLIMLEEELALLEENLELAEEQLKKSRVLFTNGLINEQNLLGAQLDVESSKLSYARKQAEYEQERRSFFSTLGIEFDTEVALSGDIDPQIIEADADVLIDRYVGNRLDVRTAALQVSQFETAAHGVAAASRAPSLSLAGRWNGGVEDLWIEASDSLSFGLTVSIPVDPWIPGSSKARAIKEAKANTESAEILLEQTWESAELEIRSLVSSIDQSLQAIEIALLQEAIAEKAYLLAEEGFQSGTVERLELWEIREDLLTARQDVLSERYQYLLYLIQLMDALNIDNLDDLEKLQGE